MSKKTIKQPIKNGAASGVRVAKDEIKVVRITNVIAAPAPFKRFFANETTLFGLPPGSKFSDGSRLSR